MVHTIVDAPQGFDNSLPPVWEVTHPELAYVRLHGRNADTWNVQGQTAASDRFNYDYTDAELAALAERIVALERRHAIGVHVVLNNNYEDQGQRNARSLAGEVRREQDTAPLPISSS